MNDEVGIKKEEMSAAVHFFICYVCLRDGC